MCNQIILGTVPNFALLEVISSDKSVKLPSSDKSSSCIKTKQSNNQIKPLPNNQSDKTRNVEEKSVQVSSHSQDIPYPQLSQTHLTYNYPQTVSNM